MWQMLRRKTRLFRRDDRGVQLVELAIALPVMILLFGTVAEFGRYFQAYSTLAKGTRVAARFVATAPSTEVTTSLQKASSFTGTRRHRHPMLTDWNSTM